MRLCSSGVASFCSTIVPKEPCRRSSDALLCRSPAGQAIVEHGRRQRGRLAAPRLCGGLPAACASVVPRADQRPVARQQRTSVAGKIVHRRRTAAAAIAGRVPCPQDCSLLLDELAQSGSPAKASAHLTSSPRYPTTTTHNGCTPAGLWQARTTHQTIGRSADGEEHLGLVAQPMRRTLAVAARMIACGEAEAVCGRFRYGG